MKVERALLVPRSLEKEREGSSPTAWKAGPEAPITQESSSTRTLLLTIMEGAAA